MGKLLFLPLKQTFEVPDLPDLTLDLRAGIDVTPPMPPIGEPPPAPPPGPSVPPIVVPPTTQPPGSGGFTVTEIGAMLPVQHSNDPTPRTFLHDSLTFHWEGSDLLTARTDEEVRNAMVGVAIQHIAKQWAPGVYGFGIMYHEVICPSGNSLVMHDYGDVLWHCGDDYGNRTSRAILVYCSTQTPPTAAQMLAIRKRRADFDQSMGHAVPAYPHSRWSATACPGDQIRLALGY